MAFRRSLQCLRSIARQSRRPIATFQPFVGLQRRHNSSYSEDSTAPVSKTALAIDDVEALLKADPAWSVESLLPRATDTRRAEGTADVPVPRITTAQLHHLLRLSALPLPKSQEDEEKMLSTLSDQLHFVGKMQQVDTTNVKPLRAIRDETVAAEHEQTVTLDTMKDALAKEKVIGKHYKRIRRDTTPVDASDVEKWDVLGSAERKQGKYFVVESERPLE